LESGGGELGRIGKGKGTLSQSSLIGNGKKKKKSTELPPKPCPGEGETERLKSFSPQERGGDRVVISLIT